jgi:hypothetical protein
VPDRLELVANPPQRILLSGDAKWLARKVIIYASIMSGNKVVENATNKILFEVIDETGKVIRSFEKNAVKGKVVFNGESYVNAEFKRDEKVITGEEYVEEKTVFRVSTPGLAPVEIKIKKAETLKGNN